MASSCFAETPDVMADELFDGSLDTCFPVFVDESSTTPVKTRLQLRSSHKTKIALVVLGHGLDCSPLLGIYALAISRNGTARTCVHHAKTTTSSSMDRCYVRCQCYDGPCVEVRLIFNDQEDAEEVVCEITEVNY